MVHIRGYLKRKEQKDEIWREVYRELNKPGEAALRQEPNLRGQVVNLPETPNTQPHIEKLLLMQEESTPGFLPISPFVVSLPMNSNGETVFHIYSTPKMAPCTPSPETGQPRWPFILFWVSGTVLVLATIGKKFRLR